MGKSSRDKGKRGELEAVHIARPHFPKARRSGVAGQADGDLHEVPAYVEVRRREKGDPGTWLEEAISKAGGRRAVVAYRRNNDTRWKAVMDLSDYFKLLASATAPTAESQDSLTTTTSSIAKTVESSTDG